MTSTIETQLRRRRRYALGVIYLAFLLAGVRGGFLVGLPQNRIPPGFVA